MVCPVRAQTGDDPVAVGQVYIAAPCRPNKAANRNGGISDCIAKK